MKYFTIKELIKSVTANKKGIHNNPSLTEKDHLVELVENLLDPLREAWGSAIKVTSGFRCPALNRAVGGAKKSAHMTGYAADLKPVNGKMKEFQAFAKKWIADKKFDQFIIEKPQKGIASWIHIGIKNQNGLQRKQFLTKK